MQHLHPILLSFMMSTLAACHGAAPALDQPEALAVVASPDAVEEPGFTAEQHYTRAHEFAAAGKYSEARAEAEQAMLRGHGHDARLFAAKLAILADDLAGAAALLEPLAEDPQDALTHYNLGLIAHRRGDYNRARSEYLAALKADPRHVASRHNLALLAWDAGVHEEAKHHARKFIELAPTDPHAANLRSRLERDVTLSQVASR